MDPERSLAAFGLAAVIALLAGNGVLLVAQLAFLRTGKVPAWLKWLVPRPGPAMSSSRAITTALTTIEMPAEDQRIVNRALAFRAKVVSEVMVPRPDMISVPAHAPVRDVLAIAARSSHSRVPVYEGDLDHIVGFVHAKDLLKLAADATRPLVAREIMRQILAVPENKSVDDMLREFQQHKTHVAIVIDEFGGTSGMVTINDLLEELVGELFDEVRTEQPDFESLADGSIRVSGRMAIVDLNERFGLSLPDDEFNTVAGLVFGFLGRTPSPGDTAEIEGIRMRVEATNGRRATQLVIQPPATSTA